MLKKAEDVILMFLRCVQGGFYLGIIITEKLIGSSHHVDLIGLALCAILIEEVLDMDVPVLTREQIEAMENVDVRTVDPSTLRDIRDVTIHRELPKQERILDYIRQIGNPYCYRYGKYIVKVSFVDTDVTLEDRLLAYIRSKC